MSKVCIIHDPQNIQHKEDASSWHSNVTSIHFCHPIYEQSITVMFREMAFRDCSDRKKSRKHLAASGTTTQPGAENARHAQGWRKVKPSQALLLAGPTRCGTISPASLPILCIWWPAIGAQPSMWGWQPTPWWRGTGATGEQHPPWQALCQVWHFFCFGIFIILIKMFINLFCYWQKYPYCLCAWKGLLL